MNLNKFGKKIFGLLGCTQNLINMRIFIFKINIYRQNYQIYSTTNTTRTNNIIYYTVYYHYVYNIFCACVHSILYGVCSYSCLHSSYATLVYTHVCTYYSSVFLFLLVCVLQPFLNVDDAATVWCRKILPQLPQTHSVCCLGWDQGHPHRMSVDPR